MIVKQHFHKLALIVALGSGFAVAQSMPQNSQSTAPGSSSQASQPSSTSQQPSAVPQESKSPANAPETLPNTDQKKTDQSSDQNKLPQSDAAPAAAVNGDVQNSIQSALQKDPSLANANINVQVSGKTVELIGTVPTKDAKDAAARIAKENANGLKVKNSIKVASTDHDSMDKANPNNPK
jgi:osmotically-inducible protein OsmY